MHSCTYIATVGVKRLDHTQLNSTQLLIAASCTRETCTLREAVELAEEGSEHPAVRQTVDKVDPCTRRRHHDVGHGQVDYEVVGRGVHSLVACDDQ